SYRQRKKDGGSGAPQKYEPLEELGDSTADAPPFQPSSDAPYDPPTARLSSFPPGYVVPEIGYEYKSPPDRADAPKKTPPPSPSPSLPPLPSFPGDAPPPYGPPTYVSHVGPRPL
ncbi:uncharacterized protein PHACADRAFT_210417, partial [Phanerochaete carnosa HHB-10118-sp]